MSIVCFFNLFSVYFSVFFSVHVLLSFFCGYCHWSVIWCVHLLFFKWHPSMQLCLLCLSVVARGENGREGCKISSSHSSSPKLIKLVIFSCPYWYIDNIHFSLIKPNPNPKHEHKRINPTGPINSMTHNQCHQSCKGESRTQDHSHTKLGTFRSTTKVIMLVWQSLAFYSNRVIAEDPGYSHFLWAGTFIMFFQLKFKFSKRNQTVHDFIQNLFFF